MWDGLKEEFTKRPEELNSSQLAKATKLANVFTTLRKFLYCFFSITSMMAVVWMFFNITDIMSTTAVLILGIIYSLFKVRDFFRGTI